MCAHRADPRPRNLARALAEAREENTALRLEIARLHRLHAQAARAADERFELRTFFALLAHQLKSPLLALDVSLAAIRRALDKPTNIPPDTFPRTLRQTQTLSRMIDTLLLDIPSLEDGTLEVACKAFDLRDPVDRVVGEAKQMLEARTIVCTTPSSAITVRADPERIEQIIRALLDNAVKYSAPDAPIGIYVRHDSEAALVIIEDQGIGIPTRDQPELFTKFFRASNAPSYLYQGLGISLYLARELASLCRGHLSIESAEGKGTICRLKVPLER